MPEEKKNIIKIEVELDMDHIGRELSYNISRAMSEYFEKNAIHMIAKMDTDAIGKSISMAVGQKMLESFQKSDANPYKGY